MPACAAAQLSQPGSFLSVTVGGWPVIAVRDMAGELHVLRNMCRHQNLPVVEEESGNCVSFRCLFHGWTFDLKGKFLGAPLPVMPRDSGARHDLIALPMLIEAGILFFSFDSFAPKPALGAPLPAYWGTTVTEHAQNWHAVAESLPPSEWQGPLLAIQRARTTTIVHQIAPHSSRRTRLFTHVFGTPAAYVGSS